MTMTTRAMVKEQRELHVFDRGTDGTGAVGENLDLHGGWERGRKLREKFFDAIYDRDNVGARLALNV